MTDGPVSVSVEATEGNDDTCYVNDDTPCKTFDKGFSFINAWTDDFTLTLESDVTVSTV